MKRAREWSWRLYYEFLHAKSAHFVSYTYAKPPLVAGIPSLRRLDFVNYFRSLKKVAPIKYYGVGEYGEHTKRPHYHAIIFNYPDVEDLVRKWKHGRTHVGQVSYTSVNYVTNYMFNKHVEVSELVARPFALHSYGLAREYAITAKKYHRENKVYHVRNWNGKPIPMPRYIKKKIWTDFELKNIGYEQYIEGIKKEDEELDRLAKEHNVPELYMFQKKVRDLERLENKDQRLNKKRL